MNKICNKCKEEKDVSQFPLFKSRGILYSENRCFKCRKNDIKKWREKNKEHIKKYNHNYHENNKIEINLKRLNYRTENKEKLKELYRETIKKYNEKNKNKIKKYRETYQYKYRTENKEKIKKAKQIYYKNNKKNILNKSVKYRQNNKEKINKWKKENKEKIKIYHKEYSKKYNNIKRKKDLIFKMICNQRTRIYHALKDQYSIKSNKTLKLIGCTKQYLKNYIEKQFTDGMTWEKFLSGEIHIDHIKPCASFDLTKPEEQARCFHFSNLQPLWAIDNLQKGAKYHA